MNYTYLPSHPFPATSMLTTAGNLPTIIMTTNPSSKKTLNLQQNPNVSLLVHDWVSARPPSVTAADRERSPTGTGRSSLASMLMQMNSAAVSSISATINGEALVLEPGTDEEKWCKEQHLANNTFAEGAEASVSAQLFGTSPSHGGSVGGDGGRESYIEGEDVRVVVVKINDGRISDWKGGVKDWVIAENGTDGPQQHDGRSGRLVNGV